MKGHTAFLEVSTQYELGPLVITQTQSLSIAVYHMVAQHNVCILFLQCFNAMPTPLSFQCSGVSVGSRAETLLSALCQVRPLSAPPCWCVGHSPVRSGRCQTAGMAEGGHVWQPCKCCVVFAHCCHDTECCPCMQEDTGLEWDEIDQSTLEEVKKSWAHSKCREVDFEVTVSVCVCVYVQYMCVCMHLGISISSATPHKAIVSLGL